MRTLLFGVVVGVTMAASATNAFAQTEGTHDGGKSYGVFQIGATDGGRKLAVGADFAEAVNRYVEIYAAGGWLEKTGYRDTLHLTSGVKLTVFQGTFVRPYIRLGIGVMHLRMPTVLELEGTNKLLGEVGGGVAIPVGPNGYIDLGYRYFRPRNFSGFATDGVFAGFGYRY